VRLWDASAGLCYKTFAHPEKQVNCLVISPDKQNIVAAGNPQIRLYDVGSKGAEPLLTFEGHTGNVTAVGIDKAARFLFSGSEDGSIKIWDPRVGSEAVRDYDSRGAVNSVVLHPNQGELISGDHSGTLRVWDLTANKCAHELVPEGDTPISSVCIAADASLLAASNFNGNCFFWSPLSGEDRDYVPVKKLRAHKAYITACRLSPDVRYFATASSDRSLKLWNTQDFSLAAKLSAHSRWVWDAAFSADSSYIITASSDATAKLWDIGLGDVVRNYASSKAITAVALNDSSPA
jgi:G protein beta subunit-like protein